MAASAVLISMPLHFWTGSELEQAMNGHDRQGDAALHSYSCALRRAGPSRQALAGHFCKLLSHDPAKVCNNVLWADVALEGLP